MCLSGDGLSCIGSGKTDNGGTGSHSGLQTVEGVFEHVRVFGSSTEYFHTEQETVGAGLERANISPVRMRSTIPLNSGWAL